MSLEANTPALTPPVSRHAETGAGQGDVKALSRRGLSCFFDMDLPRLHSLLLPLADPTARISKSPFLSFLFDRLNPKIAPERFESHYRYFQNSREREYGMAAAIAGLLAVWESGQGFERLNRWMARLDNCLAGRDLSARARAAGHLVQGTVQLLAWGRLTEAIEKLQSAFHWADKAGSVSLKVTAGSHLAHGRLFHGDLLEGELALFDIAPLARLPQTPFYCKSHFVFVRSTFHYFNQELPQAKDLLSNLVQSPSFESLPAETHLQVYNFLLAATTLNQDTALADDVMEKIHQRAIPEENRFSHSLLHYCLALAALFRNEPYKALLHEQQSTDLLAGLTPHSVGFYWNALLHGQALADLNRTEEALAYLRDWMVKWQADGYRLACYFGGLEIAHLLLKQGDPGEAAKYYHLATEAVPHKESVPVLGRPVHFPGMIKKSLFPDSGPVLVAEERRETAIHVQALAGFTVRVQGETIYDRNWRSKRSKQLLKALIVFGGSKVSMDLLADTLWPDADGDQAMNSLKVTCSRLRRIGCAPGVKPLNWIKVFHGQVSLIRSLCEVDAIRFQELLARGLKEDNTDILISALEMYSGDFLPHDRSEIWIIEHRHRLRAEYARGAMALTRHCLARQCPEKALPYLTKSLQAAPLDEPLHTLAMQACLAMGYPSHAIQIYRRIEKSLYQELDALPGQALGHWYEKARIHGQAIKHQAKSIG